MAFCNVRIRLAAACLHLCGWLLLAAPTLAAAFGFDDVAREAAALARRPYQSAPPADARMAALSYDEYRDLRFKPERARWRDGGSPFSLQFFPLGRGFTRPLRLYEIAEAGDGQARVLEVPAADFQVGQVATAAGVQPLPGAAGWRLSYPLLQPDRHDEVVVFLGASYFRAIGAGQAYGLSARALAVDTAGGRGEEFPAFTTFWFERPAAGATQAQFYALLDSPRVAGAYRFVVRPGTDTVLDVQARLFLRAPVATLGIAPLTSMFLTGENQPAAHDYRPEVHDSDGLLVASGDGGGERIWRPLTNPARPFVTSFALRALRGFGLMQRDRAFTSYEDLEAHYQRRPSAWVEPLGDWGPGRVELLQFGTPDETHDNIAAYWVPQQLPPTGEAIDLAWRVHWTLDTPGASTLARVTQSRRGHGFRPDGLPPQRHQFHIDFAGAALLALPAGAAVDAVASANANVRALRAHAYPNPERGGWRVSLEFDRVDSRQAVELRLQLRLADKLLSETWAYALAPE
jgi:glucans biosynthesis protein